MPEQTTACMPDTRLIGIGGWLLILVIKLCSSTITRLLVGVAAMNHLIGILNISVAALAGAAAYLLIRKNSTGVALAKLYLIIDILWYALELMTGSTENSFKTGGFLAAAALFLIYLYRSQRIKNTYFAA
ncbi:MAG: hypothetical protein WCE63_21905 [Acidobacteriaceae bacterium]